MQHVFLTSSRIPFTDFLRCNLSKKNYFRLLQHPIPEFCTNMLDIWFDRLYVPPKPRNDPNVRSTLLSMLFCFNEGLGGCTTLLHQFDLYAWLATNDVYTVADVIANNVVITQAMVLCAPHLLPIWSMLINHVPTTWMDIITQQSIVSTPHIVYKFISGEMSVRACRLWLESKRKFVNNNPIGRWATDLAHTIDELRLEWHSIARRYLLVASPYIQDFYLMFINRAYCLNSVVCKFRSDVSSVCSLCFQQEETYLHLFYDCTHTKKIWRQIKRFYQEFVDDDYLILTEKKCLLAAFDTPLLQIISIIVNKRIFFCKINNFPLVFATFIQDIQRERNIQQLKARDNKNKLARFHAVWGPLAEDIPFDEQLQREFLINQIT